ncbi:hypothetical protein ABH999_000833 [Bradyrhizobium yuanmingense]|uniref:hypothetical protein n=1 Tax=Bradyrhizobium yuanmingense TaxID=108015 RepID=UPI00351355DA
MKHLDYAAFAKFDELGSLIRFEAGGFVGERVLAVVTKAVNELNEHCCSGRDCSSYLKKEGAALRHWTGLTIWNASDGRSPE